MGLLDVDEPGSPIPPQLRQAIFNRLNAMEPEMSPGISSEPVPLAEIPDPALWSR